MLPIIAVNLQDEQINDLFRKKYTNIYNITSNVVYTVTDKVYLELEPNKTTPILGTIAAAKEAVPTIRRYLWLQRNDDGE